MKKQEPYSDGWFPVPRPVLLDQRLEPLDFKVFCSIANHASREGKCWPSVDTIASEVGRKERVVQRSLRKLEALGFIGTVARAGHSNVYRIKSTRRGVSSTTPSGVSSTTPRTRIS
jgi:Helix-turn-helix domain